MIRISAWIFAAVAVLGLSGCSSESVDAPPPTIVPAQAAVSPPAAGTPAGVVRPLPGDAQEAVFDATTGALAVLGPGPGGQSVITAVQGADARPVPLPLDSCESCAPCRTLRAA